VLSSAVSVSPWRYAALAVVFSLLWSSAFVAVKVGLRSSPPLFLMDSRFLVAGGVLLMFARLRGSALPRRWPEWRPLVVLGLLNYALYLGLTSMALRHLSAGMGAILASTNPLILALAAPWVLAEPLTAGRAAGLLTAFAGVVWMMGRRIGDADRPESMALALAAIVALVAGTVVFKRVTLTEDLAVVNGVQLLTAGVALAAPSALLEPLASVRFTPSFLASQAYLIVVVSWIGMLIWFWLLRHGDATRASAYFFLNPVLGVFFGALLLGEPLRAEDFAGSAAVALGIYLVQRS
jgi:drug/metabolite transporter (DMT)-like permease